MDKEDVVHIHNRILHKHKKKDTSIQIISFVATGMAIEMIMLSEVSQRESQISYDITYMWNLKKEKKVKLLSHVQLCATPWTVAYHAPPSMEFSRQEYWSGLPFPSPGDLPDPGIKPRSSTLRQMLYHLSHQGSRKRYKWPYLQNRNLIIFIANKLMVTKGERREGISQETETDVNTGPYIR